MSLGVVFLVGDLHNPRQITIINEKYNYSPYNTLMTPYNNPNCL